MTALPAYRVATMVTTVVLGVLITVLLPLAFPAGGGPTGFDRFVDDRIHSALDAHHTVYRVLVTPSDAPVVLAVLLIGVLWYAWRRDWWRAGFLLIAPELVVAVNTFALKYVWHRHLHHYLAYPSGHTVQFMAIATAFVLIVPTTRLRIGATVLAVVLLVCIAIGMIGFGYHYPTDIAGGTATAVALVTALYAALPGTLRRGSNHAAAESDPARPDANSAQPGPN
jgi:undecaprenyl-diphosphatase